MPLVEALLAVMATTGELGNVYGDVLKQAISENIRGAVSIYAQLEEEVNHMVVACTREGELRAKAVKSYAGSRYRANEPHIRAAMRLRYARDHQMREEKESHARRLAGIEIG